MFGFGVVSLFNSISTFMGYLMPQPLFEKNNSGTLELITGEKEGFIYFQRYYCYNERKSVIRIWTPLLGCLSPALFRYEDSPNTSQNNMEHEGYDLHQLYMVRLKRPPKAQNNNRDYQDDWMV